MGGGSPPYDGASGDWIRRYKRRGATHHTAGREAQDPRGGTRMAQAVEKNIGIETHAANERTEGTQRLGKQDTPMADNTTKISGETGEVGRSTEGDKLTRGEGERAQEGKEEKSKRAEYSNDEDVFASDEEKPNTTGQATMGMRMRQA